MFHLHFVQFHIILAGACLAERRPELPASLKQQARCWRAGPSAPAAAVLSLPPLSRVFKLYEVTTSSRELRINSKKMLMHQSKGLFETEFLPQPCQSKHRTCKRPGFGRAQALRSVALDAEAALQLAELPAALYFRAPEALEMLGRGHSSPVK